MFGIESIIAIIEGNKKYHKWLDSLPKEESDKMLEKDAKEARENLLHKRALEVAEAGRSRNFWGK